MDMVELLGMTEKDRDLYFLRKAFQSAKDLSQDVNTQTGAVIVSPDFNLISVGANRAHFGDPRRYEGRGKRDLFGRPEKYSALIHAERDVHYSANRAGRSVIGCTLYTTWAPCYTCAEITINNGIKRYVTHQSTNDWYMEAMKDFDKRVNWQESIDKAVKIFKMSNVEYICLDDPVGGVEIMFDDKFRRP